MLLAMPLLGQQQQQQAATSSSSWCGRRLLGRMLLQLMVLGCCSGRHSSPWMVGCVWSALPLHCFGV